MYTFLQNFHYMDYYIKWLSQYKKPKYTVFWGLHFLPFDNSLLFCNSTVTEILSSYFFETS